MQSMLRSGKIYLNRFNGASFIRTLLRKSKFVALTCASLLLISSAFGATTTILSGSTVNASTVAAGNDIILNAGGTLNMDISQSFNTITTSGGGISTITGSGILTTSSVTIAPGNVNTNTLTIASATTVICSSIVKGAGNGASGWKIILSGILKNSGVTGAIDLFTCNTNSTVEYNGGTQSIFVTAYYNLTLSGTLIKTLGGLTTVGSSTGGSLNVISGTTLDLAGKTPLSAGDLQGSGNITNSSGTVSTLSVGSDNNTTIFSGIISGNLIFVKQGNNGTLTLSGANTYTGTTTEGGGTIKLSGSGTLGTVAGNTTLSNNTTLDLNGLSTGDAVTLSTGGGSNTNGKLVNTSSTSSTVSGLINIIGTTNTLNLGTIIATGDIVISNTGTITSAAVASVILDGTSTASSIASIIGTGTSSLTKNGSGTWILSGANTYSGSTTINAGTLSANTLANIGTNSSLGTGSTTSAVTIGGAGILQYTGVITSSNRAIVLTSGGGSIDASGSASLTLNNGITGAFNLGLTGTGAGIESGVIATGASTMTKTGTGSWTLSAANTYTGLTTVSNGVLSLGGITGQNTITGNITINGGSLNYSTTNDNQIADASNMIISSGTFNPAARNETIGSLTMTGGSLTKGTLALTLANASVISGGALTFSSTLGGITTNNTLALGGATFNYNGSGIGDNTLNLGGDISYAALNTAPSIFANTGGGTGELQIGNGGTRIFNITSALPSLGQPEVQIAWNLAQGVGTTALSKSGTGMLLLSGNLSYTGTTTISTGELRLNPSADITINTQVILNGGKLSTTGITASRAITNLSTLNLNASSNLDLGSNSHSITFGNSSGVTWNGITLIINGWTGTGGLSGTSGRIFFGNGTGTLTNAQLAKISFAGYSCGSILLSSGELVPAASPTILATSGTNGTLTPAGTTTVNCGGSQTYTITPASCYHVLNVLVDGASNAGAISSGTYAFNNVQVNHTISATFAVNTYIITATSGANGTVTPAGTTTINCGGSQTYMITAASCYHILDVLVDGVSNAGAISSGSYAFTNVQAAHTISATFAVNTYTITATSGTNGTVTPAGTTTVNCGGSQSYIITPASCYHILNVLADGVSNAGAISSGTYAFTNVQATHTISATFAVSPNTWTSSTGLGNPADWNNANNWTCGVPTSTTDGIIPVISSGVYPIVNSGYSIHNITINVPGASTPSVTTTAIGILTITGIYTNSGTLANNGKIILNGTTQQSFPGSNAAVTAMNALEVNNASGVLIDKSFTLSGVLTPTLGTITLGSNNITLHSDAALTARVAQIPTVATAFAPFNYNGTGRFIIEQFMHNPNTYTGEAVGRTWRLMTAPLAANASETIRKAWQNNGNYVPGVGTLVTGPGGAANGFDPTGNNNVSLKIEGSNLALISVPNTNTLTVAASTYTLGGTPANKGYFMFVRGDRNPGNVGVYNSNSTTLSTAGKLQTGDMRYVFPSASNTAGAFTMLPNPYASPVDFDKVWNNTTTTNILRTFFAWNPKKNLYAGGYVTISYNSVSHVYDNSDPVDASNTQTQDIQTNQTVYVQTATPSAGTTAVAFDEGDKSSVYKNVFRPVTSSAVGSLRVNLFLANSANTFADGALVQYNADYSNNVDGIDAIKFPNPKENIALLRNGKNLSIERRNVISTEDTVFYNLWNTTQRGYRFEFTTSGFDQQGLTAFLEDSYLKTSSPVNLNGTTTVNFGIDSNAASAKAARFRIVFKPASALPVTFTSVKAYQQNSNINVEWKVDNEMNIKEYQVERSADGTQFSHAITLKAAANNNSTAFYQWPDTKPSAGNNYYRISSVDVNGKIQYSNVVKVFIGKGKSQLMVYPNPVTEGNINVQLINQPKGIYLIKLMNKLGQVILTKQIEHEDGSSTETMQMSKTIAHGSYQLQISKPDNSKTNIAVLY